MKPTANPEPIAAVLPTLTAEHAFPHLTEAERDARHAAHLEASLATSARQRFDTDCPPGLHPTNTDWNHPGLLPYVAQIAAVRNWRPNADGKGIIATGPTGRGKSRAFWALAERLRCGPPRHEVTIYRAQDFFVRLQSEIKYGNDDARGFIKAVAASPFLFIDDLGHRS